MLNLSFDNLYTSEMNDTDEKTALGMSVYKNTKKLM